jgi:hypothetical protein
MLYPHSFTYVSHTYLFLVHFINVSLSLRNMHFSYVLHKDPEIQWYVTYENSINMQLFLVNTSSSSPLR